MSDVALGRTSIEGLPVELVRWPAEGARRDALARAGVPRLLLIDPEATPPAVVGVDEDWVRLPADESDVVARATRLLLIGASRVTDTPYIDANRILHRAGATVALTSTEAALLAVLLRTAGSVVSRSELEERVWGSRAPSREAVDAAIYRLRRRLEGLSLCIRAARGQGFVVYLDAP